MWAASIHLREIRHTLLFGDVDITFLGWLKALRKTWNPLSETTGVALRHRP